MMPLFFYDLPGEVKPTWKVVSSGSDGDRSFEVKFCPFCGKKLPDIEPSGSTEKICKITDGGYYCDTCGERLRVCECLPITANWKPVEHAMLSS